MKNRIVRMSVVAMMIAILASACMSTTIVSGPKKLPPGQAKKVVGAQSAKSFAPGQQKKKK